MGFYVYKITCEKNGKAYIGCTRTSVEKRFKRHCLLANSGRNMPICDAIRIMGKNAFKVETVYEAVDEREMFMAEKAIISSHGTMFPLGYNYAKGGMGGAGFRESQESRKLRSERMKALWADPEWRAKNSKKIKDGQSSQEVRARMRAGIKAARQLPSSRRKTGAQMKARWRSDAVYRETMLGDKRVEKFKESMKKHWGTPEHKKKISDGMKRVPLTPERREVLVNAGRAGAAARWSKHG